MDIPTPTRCRNCGHLMDARWCATGFAAHEAMEPGAQIAIETLIGRAARLREDMDAKRARAAAQGTPAQAVKKGGDSAATRKAKAAHTAIVEALSEIHTALGYASLNFHLRIKELCEQRRAESDRRWREACAALAGTTDTPVVEPLD